ncbi:hypothetical protein FOL47_010270 [Perkinsus chesapeaki]|uniref:inosine/xanthosine triphosphatase n=1 Tax=Perkinsus chesapeaki TaxID=330153 RepID=A0A7J6L3U1_PERCH|nr:hypothetical protein FOL47_010270 [Perkinsus chesapeaki]
MSETPILVLVASLNPVKIDAARIGIERYTDREVNVIGEHTHSGVSDQPIGDDETLRGARNRLKALRENPNCRHRDADYYVSFEGGVFKTEDGRLHVAAWVCVAMKGFDYISEARTATFQVPPAVQKLMEEEGLELGDADDIIFNRKGSGKSEGTVGILTGGRLCRDRYYAHAMELAMIPFINNKFAKISALGIEPVPLMSAVHKGKKAVQANGQLRFSAKHMLTGAIVSSCINPIQDFTVEVVLRMMETTRLRDDIETPKLAAVFMAMLLSVPQQRRSDLSYNAIKEEFIKDWYKTNVRECIKTTAAKLVDGWKTNETLTMTSNDNESMVSTMCRVVISVPDLMWLSDVAEQLLYDDYGADSSEYRINLKKILEPLKHSNDISNNITRDEIINIASNRDTTEAHNLLHRLGQSVDTRKRELEHEESVREAKQLREALDSRYNHIGEVYDTCPSCGVAGRIRYRFLEGYGQSDCRKTEVWGGSTEMHATGPRKEAKCDNCENVWTFED